MLWTHNFQCDRKLSSRIYISYSSKWLLLSSEHFLIKHHEMNSETLLNSFEMNIYCNCTVVFVLLIVHRGHVQRFMKDRLARASFEFPDAITLTSVTSVEPARLFCLTPDRSYSNDNKSHYLSEIESFRFTCKIGETFCFSWKGWI